MIERFSSSSDTGGSSVAYFSTYPPRECGIATFTEDLIDSIDEVGGFKPSVVAINEKGAIYDYDTRVKCSIERDCAEDYLAAAKYVNSSKIQLVNLQHEFGLFGGDWGEHVTTFMENVKKPVVTTLHTVQPNFSQKALQVLKSITDKSAKIVVIAHSAIKILKSQGISYKKCVVIPHGCPNIEFADSNSAKESLGLKNRLVASTFGLMSSSKGIEYAIRALPEVIKKEPKILYLVIGQTHPEIRKQEGEKYRSGLTDLVTELGLDEHVKFHNKYLSKSELKEYLTASDIYLTPYISPNQISSGTLTYAMGAGKAVVSTPYLHAQEMLAGERGILCKFNDPSSISDGIKKFLDEKYRKTVQKRAYRYSRRFLWKNVARKYAELFTRVITN